MDGFEIADSDGRAHRRAEHRKGASTNQLGRGTTYGFKQNGRAESTELADLEDIQVHFQQLKASIQSRCTIFLLEN